jgi:hypothetical protein
MQHIHVSKDEKVKVHLIIKATKENARQRDVGSSTGTNI